MRIIRKYRDRSYEVMRPRLIDRGKLLGICNGDSYFLYHGTIYADGYSEIMVLGDANSAHVAFEIRLAAIDAQFADAIGELEDEAREFEDWPRGTGVYRLPSGRYVADGEFERVASRVAGGLNGLLLVTNGELSRREVEDASAARLEQMAVDVCDSDEAVCYYTEVDY